MKRGDIDWEEIFGKEGARWFHTGGIFCALSETTPKVAREAMEVAKKHGTSSLTILIIAILFGDRSEAKRALRKSS